MIKYMVSEDDLHMKTLDRSDWAKFMNSAVKDTEK